MTDPEQNGEKELIIIRRRYDMDMDRPHGGVWKIAHADFMTAMMAFFMVMWLISSTDDAAKKHIARYFNPVKLSEMTPFPKGLDDPNPNAQSSKSKTAAEVDEKADRSMTKARSSAAQSLAQSAASSEIGSKQAIIKNVDMSKGGENHRNLPTYTEAEIFSDPYGVLDHIVMEAQTTSETEQDASQIASIKSQAAGEGGAAMRDPFAPLSWRLNPLSLNDKDLAETATSSAFSLVGNDENEASQDGENASALQARNTVAAKASAVPLNKPTTPLSDLADQESPTKSETGDVGETSDDPTQIGLITGPIPNGKMALVAPLKKTAGDDKANPINYGDDIGQTGAIAQQLNAFKSILAGELNQPPRQLIGNELTVTTSGDDILINVSDSANYGMFAIGSSEPTARTIKLLERIAKSLNKTKGDIIIRGHTDARPFRNGKSDNWHLSTARAHMARYMLIRGGLDEKRLLRVEGYADRALKHPDHPDADDNRRIEILIHPAKETRP
nr:MotB family protein [uncultured Cohaesibacter sp.]